MTNITKQNARDICRAKPDKWDKDTPFVYGYYVHLDKDWIFYWDETNPLGDKMVMVEIDPDTKCRCTGWKDKNSVWIFEKDKVECWKKQDCFTEEYPCELQQGFATAVIVFKGLSAEFDQVCGSEWFFYGPEGREFYPEYDFKGQTIEIIGNTIEGN